MIRQYFPNRTLFIFQWAKTVFIASILTALNVFVCPILAYGQQSARQIELADRIESVSKQFLGLPYRISPLGEGGGLDNDPLIRFDVFDCTTYVETVGALALTFGRPKEETISVMNQIRYSDGRPSIQTRNHFTSLDWIPNNVHKGLLEDITRSVYPYKTITIQTSIDKRSWFIKNFEINFDQPIVKSKLDVIRIKDVLLNETLLDKIPSGSVVNFVTKKSDLKEKIGTDLDISHQGILIRVDGKLMLRHARSISYGVIEETFFDYLKQTSSEKVAFNIVQFVLN